MTRQHLIMSEDSLLFAEIHDAVEPDGIQLQLHLDDYIHSINSPEYNPLDLKFARFNVRTQSSLDKQGLSSFHASVLGMATSFLKKEYQNNPDKFDLEQSLHRIGHMFSDSSRNDMLLAKKQQL